MPCRIVLLYVLFLVAVQAAEATPTIALAVSSITTPEETTSTPVEVTVFDTDTALSSLTVSVTDSSDTDIIRVSPADWSVSGNGTNSPTRQLTVTPRTKTAEPWTGTHLAEPWTGTHLGDENRENRENRACA